MQRRLQQDFVRVGHKRSVYRVTTARPASLRHSRPSVIGPERFPRGASAVGGYPFGGDRLSGRPAFQKFISVAVLLPESFRGGCSFGLRPQVSRSSPARDHVLAIAARLTADGDVAAHSKGGGSASQRKPRESRIYSHSLRELRCPECPEFWPRPPKSARKGPAARPRIAASDSDRM